MYASYFGLDSDPFSIAPDPRFLFMSERHREALAHLLYGVGGGGGFVLLTGEVGAGKTTVCRCFLEQIPSHCDVGYIFNPGLTVPELLQTVCDEFGVAVAPQSGGGIKGPVDALNEFLLRSHAAGRSAVLIIDEAQNLSPAVLEQLRLLTNLETAERKLLQIMLIGQPELREMLARPELEQLAQRVIARYHLGPLSRDETALYIRHRLAVAGAGAAMPFDAAALKSIHRLTGGVPRRINLIADRALLGAYSAQQPQVGRRTVEQAAREVFDTGRAAAPPVAVHRTGAAAAALALLAALGWMLWQRDAPPRDGGAAAVAAVPAAAPASAPASASAGAVTTTATTTAALLPTDAAAPAPAVADDAAALLADALPDEATAWRELALRWNVAIGDGDPCAAAAQVRLMCYRSATGGLPLIRQLARPGIVSLRGDGGVVRWAVLVSLDGRHAGLQVGRHRHTLTLPALARAWRGDFATFWRAPPEWREGADALAIAPLRTWVEARLAAAGFDDRSPLRSRVTDFQLAQGLPPDGLAGPMTLMRLASVAGGDEPAIEEGR